MVPVRRFMKKVLRSMGHAVTEADDLEGVAAGAGGYDLVVANADLLGGAAAGDAVPALRARARVEATTPVVLLVEGGAEAGHVYTTGPATWLARSASVLEVIFTVNELLFPEESATRAYGRVYGGFEVEFTPAGGVARAVGLIYNLSRTGAFVETTRLPAEGETVGLLLRLPDHDHPVTVHARVVRVNAPGAGRDPVSPSGFAVTFLDLDAAHASTLDEFVAQRRVVRTDPKP